MNKYAKYETFWRRLFALIIDFIILSIVLEVFEFLPEIKSLILSSLISTLILSIPYLYAILMIGKFGQTLGKFAMKIKIVDHPTEGRVTFYQAFLREALPLFLLIASITIFMIAFTGEDLQNFKLSIFGSIIVFLPPSMLWIWSVAEIVTMLFDDKFRALHDKIAGTVVIRILNDE